MWCISFGFMQTDFDQTCFVEAWNGCFDHKKLIQICQYCHLMTFSEVKYPGRYIGFVDIFYYNLCKGRYCFCCHALIYFNVSDSWLECGPSEWSKVQAGSCTGLHKAYLLQSSSCLQSIQVISDCHPIVVPVYTDACDKIFEQNHYELISESFVLLSERDEN